MKKTRIYIVASVCMWAVFACAQIEEPKTEDGAEMIKMSFTATIANDIQTKTTLEGSLEDGILQTMWLPSDAIGIGTATAGAENTKFEKFVNTQTSNSETGIFEGSISLATDYYAIYPYSGSSFMWLPEGHIFMLNLPQTQKYVEGSFATEAAPMIASATAGEVFEFQNLCGILALRLKGNEKVESITFSGKDVNGELLPVSGGFIIQTSDLTNLKAAPSEGAIAAPTMTSVTLLCDEPVQLSTTESTPFYFVLPPATYNSFTVLVTTEDGKVMMKEGKTPLTIERAHAKPTAALEYAETEVIDLSVEGTANCYIVPPTSGIYSFKADVIGNGDFGIVPNGYFHTTNPKISPYKAELLWEDHVGMIIGPSYANGNITFLTTGIEGNAVIAAKDINGTILWSWHIWCTDQPQPQIYVNSTGEYAVLDRNLGATRADRGTGDQWMEAIGLAYQWGRKDPFTNSREGEVVGNLSYAYQTSPNKASIEESIRNPKILYGTMDSRWMKDETNSMYWTPSQKTIYDPCPAGYQVAYSDVWRSFTTSEDDEVYNVPAFNVAGVYKNGYDWIYDGSNTTYYPSTWSLDYGVNWGENLVTELWRSEIRDNYSSNIFQNRAHPEDSYIFFRGMRSSSMANGHMVRCVAETNTAPAIVSIEPATDITSSSASVKGRITVKNKEWQTTERGFIYRTANETVGTIKCGTGIGEFSTTLEGLQPSIKYYVKAYAIGTDSNTYYSSEVTFITPGNNGVIDLSLTETANSYIVKPEQATYSLDLVKGNSKESVGTADNAVVLWETYNTTQTVTKNTVIESVNIKDNKLIVSIPENAHPGNALVAARSGETILWSWHIWVVDYDPEIKNDTYASGAVMMDRNLGALNTIPADEGNIGLSYQWGRKDPFISSGNHDNVFAKTYPEYVIVYEYSNVNNNNLEYSIKNPTLFVNDCTWNNDASLWRNEKTIYDPCPPGWRIPEVAAWTGEGRSSTYDSKYMYFKKSKSLYPIAGYVEDNYIHNDNVGYYWATQGRNMAIHFGWEHINYDYELNLDYGSLVRCMKEMEINSGGSNEGYGESDDYEW